MSLNLHKTTVMCVEGFGCPETCETYMICAPWCALKMPEGFKRAPILCSWPRVSRSSVQLDRCWSRIGTYSWKVLAEVPCGPVEALRFQQWVRSTCVEPVNFINFVDEVNQTDWILDEPADYQVGDVFYLRTCEVVKIDQVLAPNRYIVQRGLFKTENKPFEERPNGLIAPTGYITPGEVAIYEENPLIAGRRVTFYEYNYTAGDCYIEQVWMGILEEPGDVTDGLMSQCLSAMDAVSYFTSQTLGLGRLRFSASIVEDGGVFISSVAQDAGGSIWVSNPTANGTTHVHGGLYLPVVQDDVLIAPEVTFAGPTQVTLDRWGGVNGSYEYLACTGPAEPAEDLGSLGQSGVLDDGLACEVITTACASNDPYKPGPWNMIVDGAGGYSAHPFDIIRSVAMSTGTGEWPLGGAHVLGNNGPFDSLPIQFSGETPQDIWDNDNIDDKRDRWPIVGLQALSWYMPKDCDDDPKLSDVMRELLCASFSFVTTGPDGRVRFGCLRDFLPSEADVQLQYNRDIAVTNRQPWSAVSTRSPIIASVEKCGDIYGAQIVERGYVDNRDAPKGWASKKLDLKFDGFKTGDPATFDSIQAIVLWYRRIFEQRLPVYELKLKPHVQRVTGGMKVVLDQHPALIGADACRGTVEDARLIVLESGLDPCTCEQTILAIEVGKLSPSTCVIAPGWCVEDAPTPVDVTVARSCFKGDDCEAFENGLPLSLWADDGTLLSTNNVTGVIDPVTCEISLGGPFLDSVGDPIIIEPGDVITPAADYADRGNWDTGDRCHVYLSDDDCEFPGGDEGHYWSVP